MMLYGLYIRDLDAGDFVWFTTDKSLEPGAYIRGRHHAGSPDVYVAQSIAALLLQVGPFIRQAEDDAQSSLGTPDIAPSTQGHIESEMTEGLLQHLTETSPIWVSDPHWVRDLRPVAAASG